MRVARAALLLSALAGVASAQRAAPLLKTDLIELLSSPIPHQEIADLVRRNCLAFRPSDRDWKDFSSLRASADVVASINGCGAARPAPVAARSAPVTALANAVQVIVRQPRVQADAGSLVHIVVLAARAGLPQPGAQLVLRGSAGIEGGSGRDVVAAADDSGFAIFPVRVGRGLNSYRLEVAPATGGALPGRPIIELVVRPGPPASASAEPREIQFDQGLDSLASVGVTVRDSIGYPVRGEPVVLRGGAADMGFSPDTAVTDSLGRAWLVVKRNAVRKSGTLQVQIRDDTMASIDVVVGLPLAEAQTDFLPMTTSSGPAGSGLGEPVVFEARTRLGRPAVGRVVSFRAVNAAVSRSAAITDSTGRVRVEVILGEHVGPATVVATIDSLEKRATFLVEPGPAVELILEHRGFRVNGRWVSVRLDTTFVVRLRMLDAYGNTTELTGLARMLREIPFDARIPIVHVVSIQEEPAAVALILKAIRPGRAKIKLGTGDISATFWVEVMDER